MSGSRITIEQVRVLLVVIVYNGDISEMPNMDVSWLTGYCNGHQHSVTDNMTKPLVCRLVSLLTRLLETPTCILFVSAESLPNYH